MIPSVLDIILSQHEEVSKGDVRFEPSHVFSSPGVGDLAAGAPSSRKLGSIRDPFEPELSPEGVHEETPATDEIWDDPPEWGGSDPPSSIPTRHPAGGGKSFGDMDPEEAMTAYLQAEKLLDAGLDLESALKIVMGDRHPDRVRRDAESIISSRRKREGGRVTGYDSQGRVKRTKVPKKKMGSLNLGSDASGLQQQLRARVNRAGRAARKAREILEDQYTDPVTGDSLNPDDFWSDDRDDEWTQQDVNDAYRDTGGLPEEPRQRVHRLKREGRDKAAEEKELEFERRREKTAEAAAKKKAKDEQAKESQKEREMWERKHPTGNYDAFKAAERKIESLLNRREYPGTKESALNPPGGWKRRDPDWGDKAEDFFDHPEVQSKLNDIFEDDVTDRWERGDKKPVNILGSNWSPSDRLDLSALFSGPQFEWEKELENKTNRVGVRDE